MQPKQASKVAGMVDVPVYGCKHCDARFDRCTQLGQHVQQMHPGKSTAYKHRRKIRKEREPYRLQEKLLKERFSKEFGKCPKVHRREYLVARKRYTLMSAVDQPR